MDKTHKALRVISGSLRFPIIRLLALRDMNLTEVAKRMRCSMTRTSHQMRQLKEAGFISGKQQGRKVFYSLNESKLNQYVKL